MIMMLVKTCQELRKQEMNKQTQEPIRIGMQLDCKVLVNIYQKRLFEGTHFLVCSLSRNDSYA